MATTKSETVSVRVEPWIKTALQTAADAEMRSLANMVEVMVVAYCRQHGYPVELASKLALSSTPVAGNQGRS